MLPITREEEIAEEINNGRSEEMIEEEIAEEINNGRSEEIAEEMMINKKNRWEMNLEEAKTQVWIALPIILTNLFYYFIPLISVMFAGHLSPLQFAGATLANSWASVSGFTFMMGLSGALETFCGQSFGARLYKKMGIHLQASCIICFCFSAALSLFWFYTEPILILLHQDPHISATAALYMKYLIPGLFAYGFLQNIMRFLQTQSIVWPMVICSFIPICIHIGMSYCLVHLTPLGFKGAALATSISFWISLLMLGLYVIHAKKLKRTWTGFSCECFSYVLVNLRLALPSAGMVCFEHWAFEIIVLLAGLMPNSQITTPLLAMCVNTSSVAYMLSYGLGAAASTRISNELGAGQVDRAKNAMAVTLKLSVFVIIVAIAALRFGHNAWAGLFNDSIIIKKEFASMVPFLAASIAVDAVQGVMLGVTRGCGWQHLIVYTNLVTYYVIGIPIDWLLGFKLKLYAKGIWLGLICGICCQTSTLLIIAFRKKWDKAYVSTNELGAGQVG